MPFYDYVCEVCASVSEKFHGMNEDPGSCPHCDGLIHRLPSNVTIKEDSNVGNLVKEFIKDNKELTQIEKDKLSRQEYKK